jgi:hypothetical protein
MLMLVLLAGTVVGDARMPEIGDNVSIVQSVGLVTATTHGVVTDINWQLGLIGINVTSIYSYLGANSTDGWWQKAKGENEICIGLNSISSMRIHPGY